MPATGETGATVVNMHRLGRTEEVKRVVDEDVVQSVIDLDLERIAAPKDMKHVISCLIDEQHYDKAIAMIRMNGEYVE